MIYSVVITCVAKVFKGITTISDLDIVTEGGRDGLDMIESTNEWKPAVGKQGIFPSTQVIKCSSWTYHSVFGRMSSRVFGGPKAIIDYDLNERTANSPFLLPTYQGPLWYSSLNDRELSYRYWHEFTFESGTFQYRWTGKQQRTYGRFLFTNHRNAGTRTCSLSTVRSALPVVWAGLDSRIPNDGGPYLCTGKRQRLSYLDQHPDSPLGAFEFSNLYHRLVLANTGLQQHQ